jgi:hypothetical protein
MAQLTAPGCIGRRSRMEAVPRGAYGFQCRFLSDGDLYRGCVANDVQVPQNV